MQQYQNLWGIINNKMKDIIIIGAGGCGREIKMLIDQMNAHTRQFNFLGYYDDREDRSALINGFPILGFIDELNDVKTDLCAVIAIGLPSLKKKLLDKINNPMINYPTLVHPGAIIGGDEVIIGEGCIICAGNIITVNITIGKFVMISSACTVGHDTVIEDYCSLMPAVSVSGEVTIGEGVYIGTGAKIINQLEVGKHTIIGAGAVVTQSLPSSCTAVGVPAKPIKFHQQQ